MSTIKRQKADGTWEFLQLSDESRYAKETGDYAKEQADKAKEKIDFIQGKESLINKFTNDQTSLQTQLNDLVLSSPADAEVIQARGGQPVLNARLNNIDTQLAHTMSRVPRISLLEIGCVPRKVDPNFDNAPLINLTLSTMNSGQTLYVPENTGGFTIKDTVFIPGNINVLMESTFVYDGLHDRPAIVYGQPNQSKYVPRRLRFSVESATQSDWMNDEFVGLRAYNIQECNDFKIDMASKFTHGVEFIASGQGFVYNTIAIGRLLGNKLGVLCTNEFGGWFNENELNLLSVMQFTPTNRGKSRYGIKITSKDGLYKDNNKNLIKGCYELKVADAQFENPNGEAIPIIVEHGIDNKFVNNRDELNSPTFARLLNASTQNFFEITYGQGVLDDQTNNGYNHIVRLRNMLEEIVPHHLVFDSGYLVKKLVNFSPTHKQISGVHVELANEVAPVQSNSGLSVVSDYVELSTSRGLGRFINTETAKRFLVRTDTVSNFTGRVAVRCYDANGNILNGGGATTYLRAKLSTSFIWSGSEYGGIYKRAGESSNNVFFEVTDAVKKIDVMIIRGTSACRLRSFKIYTLNRVDVANWVDYDDTVHGRVVDISQAPTFRGQLAILNNIAYVAIGVSSSNDWKPITS